jgi:hypothetical protein
MTRILIAAGCIGLGLSTAGACEFKRSVQSDADQPVLASVVTDDGKVMSEPVILRDEALPSKAPEASE